MKKKRIIFFIKYPEKGKVKTRLAKDIGEDKTIKIYKKMVEHNLQILIESEYDFDIWIKPKNKLSLFKKWLGINHTYYFQPTNDLGVNMELAFKYNFDKNIKQVIIIGSDCLDIDANLIKRSFEKLDNYEYVIGPSFDGGYYLLGLNKFFFNPEIFNNIEWSTDKVYEQTLSKLKKSQVYNLKKLTDIDTVHDLNKISSIKKKIIEYTN